jgi:hypothetical protein
MIWKVPRMFCHAGENKLPDSHRACMSCKEKYSLMQNLLKEVVAFIVD